MSKRKNKDEEEQVLVVTRIARTRKHTNSKHQRLMEMAEECGKIRTEALRRYGSIGAIGRKARAIRDQDWMSGPELAALTPLQARLWKATLQDSLDDIKACRAAATKEAIRDVYRRNDGKEARKRRTKALNNGSWVKDKLLCRLMRKHWKHGRNHCFNQIVLDPQCYKTFEHGGQAWFEVSSMVPRQRIAIPLGKYDISKIRGNIRLILRDDETIEIHHAVLAENECVVRGCGTEEIGLDAGYTEVLTDNFGNRYGEGFGDLMTVESDHRKVTGQRRNKLRAIAKKVEEQGDQIKADRIRKNNLGRKKQDRRLSRFQQILRTLIFTAVHEAFDRAKSVVVEDLTKNIQKNCGKNWNRRLAQWVKGVIREAIENISKRRGASYIPVNAAYTSQWLQCDECGSEDFGNRCGDVIHCKHCGAVYASDRKAAENILDRKSDSEIETWMSHWKVRSILLKRVCVRKGSQESDSRLRLSNQDSSETHFALAESESIH